MGGAGRAGIHARTLFERAAVFAQPLRGDSPPLGATDVGLLALFTSYRCHPAISLLAGSLFYGGRVVPGVTASARPPVIPNLPAICAIDYSGVVCPRRLGPPGAVGGVDAVERQEAGSGSCSNAWEVAVVAKLVSQLLSTGLRPGDIGVCSPYRAQVRALQPRLPPGVSLSTIDAFQGQENEVMILSLVSTRGGRAGEGDFLSDPRRMAVALTRGKRHLFVVGHWTSLVGGGGTWGRVLAAACELGPVRSAALGNLLMGVPGGGGAPSEAGH